MAFLSKDTLIQAYKVLSTNTENPSSQGATQLISAVRYLFALDQFFESAKKDCDTKVDADKNSFVSNVGQVVSLSDGTYTSNFYNAIKNDSDYKVGSNFFSVNAVNNSLVNPTLIVEFPKRTPKIMTIQNGVLKRDTSLFRNIGSYLRSNYARIAFALWLVRNENIKLLTDVLTWTDVRTNLLDKYSSDLVDELVPPGSTSFNDYCTRYGQPATDSIPAIINKEDIVSLFSTTEEDTEMSQYNLPLQTIFYGAPGTGKSHKVKEVTETLPKSDVFRTTFHPDSDYSTFVGCYKPKMVKAPIRDGSGHEITSACEDEKKRIAYDYEPQAFLKAYVRAYETNDPVFLVIEEINRGNCAQIFGDMFQLLDRNENGESDYAIKPETAIQEFLNEKLEDCDIADEVIKSGEEMRLPANLHIWATMNTSDQSLFPIDSAFKRRWDWKYMPINTRKESWSIKVNGTEYSWSSFLEKINEEIGDVTSSEDKKLGFYFCKAENGIISAEKFVSKVLFYIYNDVFKDYGFESSKNKDLFKDGDNKLAFGTFYSDNGNIREEKVELFLKNLGVEDAKRNNMISNDEEDEDGNSSTTESSSRNYDKFSINGSGRYAKNNLAAECVKKYIELNPDITVEEVLHNWSDFKNLVPHFMESKDEYDARTDNSKRSHEIPCNGSVLYVAHNGYGSNGKAQILMDSVNQKGWGLTIERHNA